MSQKTTIVIHGVTTKAEVAERLLRANVSDEIRVTETAEYVRCVSLPKQYLVRAAQVIHGMGWT